MYVRFNYKCSFCGHEEERFIKKDVMDKQYCHKTHLGFSIKPMTRLLSATHTLFRFNDTKLKR